MSEFVEIYTGWVKASPLLSAAVQFGILGTFGEHVAVWVRKKRFTTPYKAWQLVATVLGWALLGIIIKYGFTGMKGFVAGLVSHGMLPEACAGGIAGALAISVFTNLLFGPQMMFIHRVEENLILGRWSTEGLVKAWWTLVWFWIPAHTLTFALPPEYQIGLAACWSTVLGLILGTFSRK